MATTAIRAAAVVAAVNMAERQAAEYLGVSVHSLRRWRVYGGGPRYLKMGSRIVYQIKELDAFQATCIRRSTSDQGPVTKPVQASSTAARVRNIKTAAVKSSAGLLPSEMGQGGDE